MRTLPLLVLALWLPACDRDAAPAPSAAEVDRLNQTEALLDAAANQPQPGQ